MPLFFDGVRPQTDANGEQKKTNVRLIYSARQAPAVEYITDPNLPTLFSDTEYQFGGPGEVVISKGKAVAVLPPVKDKQSGHWYNVLTICDGTTMAPVGIAPYNIYKQQRDRMVHNLPSFITEDVIELPYFPNAGDIYDDPVAGTGLKFKWGCAVGGVKLGVDGSLESSAHLKAGDYITADKTGNLIKYEGNDFRKVVGQIIGVELELPPHGWLKYVQPETRDGELADEDWVNRLAAQGIYPNEDGSGYPYDPQYKWPTVPDYRAGGEWQAIDQGIPGLTDGKRMAKTLRFSGITTIAAGASTGSITLDWNADVAVDKATNLPDIAVYLSNAVVDPTGRTATVSGDVITVTYGSEAAVANLTYNKKTKVVTVTLKQAAATDTTLQLGYRIAPPVGVIPGWDFNGSIGAVYVLLKF